jgi:AcrR family transcriptional regulator
MLDSAVELFRRHGYNGTGFRDVIAHSGAPRGSIYHHFPEGKAQLAREAVARAGERIDELIRAADSGGDYVAAFETMWSWWTDYVEASDFTAGCPVAGVAVESHTETPEVVAAATAVFEKWQTTVLRGLVDAGMDSAEAQDFAATIVAALEGATLLARAARDRQPLDRVGRQLAAALRTQLSH